MNIDWAYLRKGWVSCNNARAAFAEKKVEIVTEVDAKKESFPGEAAWAVIADAEKVYVASGKKIIEFVPADADKKAMLAKITGPAGNLRAPALRRGKVFYIGFHPAMYEEMGK